MAQLVDPPPAAAAAAPAPHWAPAPVSSRIFVRCYRDYREARRAYERLQLAADIPKEKLTLVARGLEWYEPLDLLSMAKLGAILSGIVGAAVGLVLWCLGFAGAGWLAQTALAAGLGAAAGALGALVVGWARSRRAPIVTTGHVEPAQYDILVEEALAGRAREVLAG